jgi:hypothetical protein
MVDAVPGGPALFCVAIVPLLQASFAFGADNAEALKVVVFGGRPDDPESGCNGLIATLPGAGPQVHVGYATCFRGDRKINGQAEVDVRRHEAAHEKMHFNRGQ